MCHVNTCSRLIKRTRTSSLWTCWHRRTKPKFRLPDKRAAGLYGRGFSVVLAPPRKAARLFFQLKVWNSTSFSTDSLKSQSRILGQGENHWKPPFVLPYRVRDKIGGWASASRDLWDYSTRQLILVKRYFYTKTHTIL